MSLSKILVGPSKSGPNALTPVALPDNRQLAMEHWLGSHRYTNLADMTLNIQVLFEITGDQFQFEMRRDMFDAKRDANGLEKMRSLLSRGFMDERGLIKHVRELMLWASANGWSIDQKVIDNLDILAIEKQLG